MPKKTQLKKRKSSVVKQKITKKTVTKKTTSKRRASSTRKVATKKRSVAKKKIVTSKTKKTVKRAVKRAPTKKTTKRVSKKTTRASVKKVIPKKKIAKKTAAQLRREAEVQKILEDARLEKKMYKDIPSKYRNGIKKLVAQCKSRGYVTTNILMEHISLHECDDEKDIWLCIEKILEHNCIDKVEAEGWLQEFAPQQDPRFPLPEKSSYDSVQMYLKDIGKYDLLSTVEEQALAKQVFNRVTLINKYARYLKTKDGMTEIDEIKDEAGRKKVLEIYTKKHKKDITENEKKILEEGAEARHRLATANLRLVAHIAKSYTSRSRDLNLLDLVQEGADGLYKAVDGFDYRKGYKFSTYATWWIRQSVNRGLLDKSKTIRIPVHMHETIQRYHTVTVQLEQDLGRPPTVEEIAVELGETTEKVYTIRGAIQNVLKLDRPQGHGDEDGSTSIAETHTDDAQETPDMIASQQILQDQIRGILKDLSTRERQVIELRHGMNDGVQYTLEQIGKKLGVTRERVRQIESKALEKLRSHESLTKLESYR